MDSLEEHHHSRGHRQISRKAAANATATQIAAAKLTA